MPGFALTRTFPRLDASDLDDQAVALVESLCTHASRGYIPRKRKFDVRRRDVLEVLRRATAQPLMSQKKRRHRLADVRFMSRMLCLRLLMTQRRHLITEPQLRQELDTVYGQFFREQVKSAPVMRGMLEVGLENRTGTRCFMLAAVHILVLIPELFPDTRVLTAPDASPQKVTLATVINAINPNVPGTWNKAALEAVATLPRFSHDDGGQQDPNEWLMSVLDEDLLDLDVINAHHTSLRVAKSDTRIRALGPVVPESVLPLSIPTTDAWQGTLQELIDHGHAQVDLGDDELVLFDEVKPPVRLPACEAFRFVRLGAYMLCVLKNYAYSPTGQTHKIRTRLVVDTPEQRTIEVQEHATTPDDKTALVPTRRRRYSITSIVYHEGPLANRGHYFNRTWRDGNEYVFNDESVAKFPEGQMPGPMATCLGNYSPYLVLLAETMAS